MVKAIRVGYIGYGFVASSLYLSKSQEIKNGNQYNRRLRTGNHLRRQLAAHEESRQSGRPNRLGTGQRNPATPTNECRQPATQSGAEHQHYGLSLYGEQINSGT